jgi:hypothetical protein
MGLDGVSRTGGGCSMTSRGGGAPVTTSTGAAWPLRVNPKASGGGQSVGSSAIGNLLCHRCLVRALVM